MPKNDREVLRKIVSDDENEYLIELLVYARYAHDKNMWVEHCTERDGVPPSDEAENAWIADQGEHRFDELRRVAAEQFAVAARLFMADEIAAERQKAAEDSIVTNVKAIAAQVQRADGFWRQLGFALLTAALAPIIIGLVVLGAVNYRVWTPDFLQTVPPATQEPAP